MSYHYHLTLTFLTPKCHVELKPDRTHCYGAGGRGRCKAAGKIECGKWQTKN